MDQEVQVLGTASAPVTLSKMGPQDVPEVFVNLFEKTAEAYVWPRAQQLPVQHLLVYEDLKRTILLQVGHSLEQQRF